MSTSLKSTCFQEESLDDIFIFNSTLERMRVARLLEDVKRIKNLVNIKAYSVPNSHSSMGLVENSEQVNTGHDQAVLVDVQYPFVALKIEKTLDSQPSKNTKRSSKNRIRSSKRIYG